VLVRDADDGGIDLFAAYDGRALRHLAVRPDVWGSGLASRAIEAALDAMDRRGSTVAELWCLVENHRARRLYEYLGWRATEDRRPAPWPPHPTEMRYTRLIVASER
jgi:RimJ/RimL family protein N-acetyltransferase